ncbi:MAG: DNA polymerase [Terriglobia bacterium]|nr:DNA polymerase [Terriglobia bacterium]
MSKRAPHYLKANSSQDYPQQCIWFDTETELHDVNGNVIELSKWKAARVDSYDPEYDNMEVTHHLKMGYACYERRHHNGKWTDETWLRFTAQSEFWSWVVDRVRPKTKLYLFCHNTSFDLPVLDVFNQLPTYGFTLRSAIIDAPPTILRFGNGSSTIVILDTLNIWRMPLKYLGEAIGLAKLDMPDNNDMGVDWDTYGRRDVEILRAACQNWFSYLQQYDMGGFAPTLASQSMLVFRHKYMKHRIFIDTNPRALTLTREGYYGGRVEAFRIGRYQGEFCALDVNSMYPAVMQGNKYPCKLIAATQYATLSDLNIWLRSYSVCARVLLRTATPFAPVRTKHKLIFPVGQFECILSTPEIRYALEHADILEVREVAVYEHEYLFTEFVDAAQAGKSQAKRDGDTVREFHIKKLANSFYGKWGQSGVKWQEQEWIDDLSCRQWVELDMETGQRIQHRQLGGLRQVKLTDGESRDSFPAIAGHVTAYARMHLWRLIETAGAENVLYCDTDCVLVNEVGRDKLSSEMDDYALGALKIAGRYTQVEQWGAKDYKWDSKTKTKGVRKDAVWLDGWRVEQEQWSGLRGLVRAGTTDAPRTRKIIKSLRRRYSKGEVQADGRVIPHQLNLTALEQAYRLELDPD